MDGCPIECGVGVFEQAGARVTRHIRLHDYGIKKKEPPADGVDFERLIARVLDAKRRRCVTQTPALLLAQALAGAPGDPWRL